MNGLAGIIILAPKPEMSLLYDVRFLRFLCFAHINRILLSYARRAGLPFNQDNIGSDPCSVVISLSHNSKPALLWSHEA